MVREELQGYRVDDRREPAFGRGQLDHAPSHVVERALAFVDETDDLGLARCGFLQVAERALTVSVGRHQRKDGQFAVDERYWPVFHLPCWVAFGMNVGDFLQLQRALQGDWVERAARQVE